ncbi:MAG: hypothetical protein M3096_08365 [Actinomycetia bacterium]|nr:hypothetical protein [Actinomycetes bacterium]
MDSTVQVRRSGERSPARPNRTLRLFAVDAFLFALFVVVVNVPLTGLAIHEWLGIVIAIGMVVHIIQHANWVVTTTRRLMSATSFQNRVNYLLMVGIFIGFVSIIASGLLISEVALPWLGVTPGGLPFMLWLHLASVGWVIWLTAIHLAVNWRWIVSASDRLIFKRFARSGGGR